MACIGNFIVSSAFLLCISVLGHAARNFEGFSQIKQEGSRADKDQVTQIPGFSGDLKSRHYAGKLLIVSTLYVPNHAPS
jgi:hypothetical protein